MRRSSRDHGFTLIELLVVIIIIGILAAIAIPTFLHQRQKAHRAAAVSDMKNVGLSIETYATDHDGSYVGMNGADENNPTLRSEGFNPTHWVHVGVTATVNSYCVQGINDLVSGEQFVLRSDGGKVTIELLGTSSC